MAKHITFYKYFRQWMFVSKKREVSAATFKKYEEACKWIKKLAPDLYLDEMTRIDFQMLINDYGDQHVKSTTRNFLHMLSASLSDAKYDELIDKDVTYKVKAVSSKMRKQTRAMVLEYSEEQKLIRQFEKDDTPEAWLCDFDIRTGLRYAEALGLTPEDINNEKMLIDINKAYDYKKGTGFGKTKNESSLRKVAIDEKAKQDLEKAIVMGGCNDDESIFVLALKKSYEANRKRKRKSNVGHAYNSLIDDYLREACKKAGVPRISFHNLRHTHASVLLLHDNIRVETVAKRLGHASTATTLKFYTHLLKETQSEDREKIRKAISNWN